MEKKFLKQKDKQYHLIVSAGMVLTMVLLFRVEPIASAFIVLLLGILKELVYDKYYGRGVEDIDDVYANALGVLVGIVLSYIVMYLIVLCC